MEGLTKRRRIDYDYYGSATGFLSEVFDYLDRTFDAAELYAFALCERGSHMRECLFKMAREREKDNEVPVDIRAFPPNLRHGVAIYPEVANYYFPPSNETLVALIPHVYLGRNGQDTYLYTMCCLAGSLERQVANQVLSLVKQRRKMRTRALCYMVRGMRGVPRDVLYMIAAMIPVDAWDNYIFMSRSISSQYSL